MKVLGRHLPAPFDAFWDRFKSEIPVPVEYIEEGHSVVFGEQGYDRTAPNEPLWASTPADDLAYHTAHELMHIVQRERGYPKTVRGQQYPPDSAEARIGADFEEMVLHPPLEDTLRKMGFTNDFIRRRMLEGALAGVESSPPPDYGTPWFTTWAMRYCELRIGLPHDEWSSLEAVFRERSPDVVRLGEEMVSIMMQVGWGTPKQALDAMVRIRDSLGLKVNSIVLVMDPISGDIL